MIWREYGDYHVRVKPSPRYTRPQHTYQIDLGGNVWAIGGFFDTEEAALADAKQKIRDAANHTLEALAND